MSEYLIHKKPVIDVCFSPALLDNYELENRIAVVIDVLRATTSMCVAFDNGAELIVPVETIDESMAYREKGYLVGAERKGEKVEGFDFGNSPFSFMEDRIKDAKIAITTTNGTRAIKASSEAKTIVVGSFINITALTNWLREQNQNILCVCAGWKDSFNLEDTLFAGALVHNLMDDFELSLHRDAALAASHLYSIAKNDMHTFLKNSSHYIRLHKLHIDKDIKYCLTPNQTNAIPIIKDGVLYELNKLENANV